MSSSSAPSSLPPLAVVGIGYVGLPLALNFCGVGRKVIALDVDPVKVEKINAGQSYIKHIPSEDIQKEVSRGALTASLDMAEASKCDAIIICVPTPLDRHLEPDLSYVTSTVQALLPHLSKGQTMSLESTTYPGTTEEVLMPMVESMGFKVGVDYHLAYSPEREDPGNEQFPSHTIPKLVSGQTPACLEKALALYKSAYHTVVAVSGTKVAEFAKLLENTYRSVNIGLVNELKIVADKMGIDIWDVINAAATKPFGFKAFYPGPGVGGHCIPVDPFYLTWKAKEYGIHTRFVELAAETNNSMAAYVVQRVSEALNKRRKPLNGSRILAVGLAFKEEVDDLRESPTFRIMDLLAEQGSIVDYYDPYIPSIMRTREHLNWAGKLSVAWDKATLASYDCAVICTGHKAINKSELLAWSDCIVDTRNLLGSLPEADRAGKVLKA
ncbi:MAG: nucleotide sugar dehydrogenase [Verrucomicrobiaceae bacterium]|nr:nucleotide sugar dehydrogenase [Verrucomicrobiaceae bacterium]